MGETKTLKIFRPSDLHVHWRQDEMLWKMVRYHDGYEYLTVMPNTNPPILGAVDVLRYKCDIDNAIRSYPGELTSLKPLMVIKILETTTPQTIFEAKKAGAIAGKIYPANVTTNSHDGVLNYENLYPALEAMQNLKMIALFHGEKPNEYYHDREEKFLEILDRIIEKFPNLRIVMEHLTTAAAVKFIEKAPENVGATITAHHLWITGDDVVGGMLKPDYFNKPFPKRPEDRDELIRAALSGNPKFFLGSDSAPHLKENKLCECGCAGCFTAPVALPLLAELFERHGCLDELEDFVSVFGPTFYGLPLPTDKITLIKQDWTPKTEFDGVKVFLPPSYENRDKYRHTLRWQVEGVSQKFAA